MAIVVFSLEFLLGIKMLFYYLCFIKVIERTDKEIIFRLPVDIDIRGLQRIVNYFKYKEAIKTSEGTEELATKLANE